MGAPAATVLAVVLLGQRREAPHRRRDVDAVQRKARCGRRLDLRDLEVHLLALGVGQLETGTTGLVSAELGGRVTWAPVRSTFASAWSSGE